MFPHYFTKHLKEDEEAVTLVRIYPFAIGFRIMIAAILVLLPFFLMYWLLRHGLFGLLGFMLLLLIGICFALRVWVTWYLNGLLVTNKRIIDFDQKGFFNRVVSECALEKIQDVSYEVKGVWQTLFHFGSVKIQTASTSVNLEIDRVYQPQKLQELINEMQREVTKSTSKTGEETELTASELVTFLHRMRQELGEEAFQLLLRKRGLGSTPEQKDKHQ